MKVGIIGCGAIGTMVAQELACSYAALELSAVYDRVPARAQSLTENLNSPAKVVATLTRLFELSELIVEAASSNVVEQVLRLAITHDTNVLIMSTAGVLLHPDIIDTIREQGHPNIYLPSGALGGLDALSAARLRELEYVMLTTSKPPQALAGAPYVQEHGIDLCKLDKATLIFEGPARQAIEAFPKNINVSATLSLAGIGLDKTYVRIIADPGITRNTHHLRAKGRFGEMEATVRNVPSEGNPKTSYLAALSALAVLRRMADPIKTGT